jgi:hypothetical protein
MDPNYHWPTPPSGTPPSSDHDPDYEDDEFTYHQRRRSSLPIIPPQSLSRDRGNGDRDNLQG